MANILPDILKFAEQAHGSQMRKYASEPYIRHPERVMETCKKYTSDIHILSAALLHDVLEDTPVTEKEMFDFLEQISDTETANKIMSLVVDLTDVFVKEDYPQWNRRKRKALEVERLVNTSPDSQTIKYADIIDNAKDIVRDDKDFAVVFLRECKSLLKKLDKGDPGLYLRAVTAVEEGLKQIGHK